LHASLKSFLTIQNVIVYSKALHQKDAKANPSPALSATKKIYDVERAGFGVYPEKEPCSVY